MSQVAEKYGVLGPATIVNGALVVELPTHVYYGTKELLNGNTGETQHRLEIIRKNLIEKVGDWAGPILLVKGGKKVLNWMGFEVPWWVDGR